MMIAAMWLMLSPVGGIDWEKKADRTLMVGGFSKMAAHCETFGFTRVAETGSLEDRMEAYLLLEDSPEYTVSRWSELFIRSRALDDAEEDKIFLDKLGGAVLAAVKDPSTYDRALKIYSDTFMVPFEKSVQACRDAAADPFLGRNFVTGAGNADAFRRRLAGEFRSSVAKVASDK